MPEAARTISALSPGSSASLEESLLASRDAALRNAGLRAATRPRHAFRLGNSDAATVTLLKRLAGPCTVVATLLVALKLDQQPIVPQIIAVMLVTFLLCDRILSIPELQLGSHRQMRRRPTPARVLLEWYSIVSLLAIIGLALHVAPLFPRAVILGWVLATPATLLLSNFGVLQLARWWHAHLARADRYIIIGATDVGLELARRVDELGHASGEFLGFFDFRNLQRLPELAPQRWGGSCEGVADYVRKHAVETIYIALPISSAPRITELLQQLRDTTASVYFVPNLFAFDLVQPRCIEIHGIPALAVCESPHLGMGGLGKRLSDILLCLAALIPAAPVMLAIAAAVKLSSPGPVLFRQRRYGLNGEEIFVYKFRTMTVCEDGDVVRQATRNDQRITPLGRLLRRTSLDELPQLFNVLEGKMSIVGPRPHAVAHNEQYRKLISGYMIRHKVRPGITGWAQVNGLRGETSTIEKMRKRVDYDIEYLNNWSLWLDLKILLRTALLFIRDDHAY